MIASMRLAWMLALVSILSLVGSASVARADAIEGPPACPPGSSGRSSHHGQWCEPAVCDAEAACEGGARCTSFRVCTRGSLVPPNHRLIDPAAVPVRMEMVIGTCDPAEACTGLEEPPPPTIGAMIDEPPACRAIDVCVPSALPSLPTSASPAPPVAASPSTPPSPSVSAHACGCAAIGASRETPSLLPLPLLLVLVLRPRRRRA
jgi:hypothetical protein